MDTTALSVTPSLVQYFAQERRHLQSSLKGELSPEQVVGEMRRALDRTGLSFTRSVTDPQIQKVGLWLLEIIKSGAGVLDRATHAEVTYVETAPKLRWYDGIKDWRPGAFYMLAAGLVVAGLWQGSALLVMGSTGLALLHGLSSLKGEVLAKLPFIKTPKALPSPDGRFLQAEAFIKTDTAGLLNQVSEALATADYILARLVQTEPEKHWRDDQNLMALFQNLLEANISKDGKYALQVVGKEMNSVLAASGIETVTYSKKTAHWFDELPALIVNEGEPELEMAAPALVTKEGRLLRRGTIWVRSK